MIKKECKVIKLRSREQKKAMKGILKRIQVIYGKGYGLR